MSDAVQAWECPGCQRRFEVPAGKKLPEYCPDCRKVAGEEFEVSTPIEDIPIDAPPGFVRVVPPPQTEEFKEVESRWASAIKIARWVSHVAGCIAVASICLTISVSAIYSSYKPIYSFGASEDAFIKVMKNSIDGDFEKSQIATGLTRIEWKKGDASGKAFFQSSRLVAASVTGKESGDVYNAYGALATFCTDGIGDKEFADHIDAFSASRLPSSSYRVIGGHIIFNRDQSSGTLTIYAVSSPENGPFDKLKK